MFSRCKSRNLCLGEILNVEIFFYIDAIQTESNIFGIMMTSPFYGHYDIHDKKPVTQ